jgi:hypothetical protein
MKNGYLSLSMSSNLRLSDSDSLSSGIASKQQLERLIKLTISIKPSTHFFVPELHANTCVAQALRLAHFWESPNLRREPKIIPSCNRINSTGSSRTSFIIHH